MPSAMIFNARAMKAAWSRASDCPEPVEGPIALPTLGLKAQLPWSNGFFLFQPNLD